MPPMMIQRGIKEYYLVKQLVNKVTSPIKYSDKTNLFFKHWKEKLSLSSSFFFTYCAGFSCLASHTLDLTLFCIASILKSFTPEESHPCSRTKKDYFYWFLLATIVQHWNENVVEDKLVHCTTFEKSQTLGWRRSWADQV